MHRRLQFGVRENPASNRRHGSRLAANVRLEIDPREGKDVQQVRAVAAIDSVGADADSSEHAAPRQAATVEKEKARDWDAFRLSLSQSQSHFEPLLGSEQAARLLGNIHVKTLQRYARKEAIPGYRIGGHWYFRASDLDTWLRSRLNSSCHPCRLQEKPDGT